MSSPDYTRATNAAYKVLTERKIFSIKTDVFAIAKSLPNCKVLSYKEAAEKYGYSRQYLLDVSAEGFSEKLGNKTLILYNESQPLYRIRFTIAHEIGHFILEHPEDNPVYEKEANCFARNLLCPVPIIRNLHISTVEEYVDAFEVSKEMAVIAIEKLKIDLQNLAQAWYNAFMERLHIYLMGFSTMDGFNAYLLS